MNSSEITPSQPNLPPNIRHAPGLTLTAAEAILLARAFPDNQEIFVEREFRSGYSGAVVLLVSPGSGQAQVVVKLGSATELQREYAAYRQYVKQASPQNTARLQGEPLLTDDEQLALLSYTFAGGDPRQPTNSLQAYYESKGGRATAAVLDRVFRTYGRQWWAINRPQKFVVSEQYDRLLPVHLDLKPTATIETNPETLVAGQTNAVTLRDLQPDQPVRLKGFRVAETRQDRQEVKLTADPLPGEASAPLRIRLETNEIARYRSGEQLERLDAVITATRQTLLAEAVRSALPTFDPETAHLNLNSRTYPNPLYNLPDLLDRVIETKVSTIHGDLNLQNILVDEETGFAWLIDFAETRRGPTLFDLQRLEGQVITKLLPPSIVKAGLELVVVADLLESLHADPPSPTAPYTALQESYTVLVTLRRLARQYLMDDRDWDEYYLGLVITLVGSLKYPELEATGRQLALIGAAVAQESIGKPITAASFAPKGGRAVPVQGRGGVAVVESPVARPSSRSTRWLGWIGQIFGRKPASDPPLALVINVEGQVEVRRKASDRVIPAAFGMQLFPEDAVITYEASASDIVCHNGFLFHLDRHSTLVVRCEEIDDRLPIGRLPPDLSHQLAGPGAGTLMSQADLAAAEQAIKTLPLSNKAQRFLQAKLYQQSGLLKEAIRELEDLASQEQRQGLAKVLGEAYFQDGSLDRAEASYTTALNVASFRRDSIGQAEVRVGLGHVAKARNEMATATIHWQTAEELYRQEGYYSQAEEIATLLLLETVEGSNRLGIIEGIWELGKWFKKLRVGKLGSAPPMKKGQPGPKSYPLSEPKIGFPTPDREFKITKGEEGAAFAVLVVPEAAKNEVVGKFGDAIKIHLTSNSVGGIANDTLIHFVSDKLNVKRERIIIAGGLSSAEKMVIVPGINPLEVETRLLSPQMKEEKPLKAAHSIKQFWPALNRVASAGVLLIFFIVFSAAIFGVVYPGGFPAMLSSWGGPTPIAVVTSTPTFTSTPATPTPTFAPTPIPSPLSIATPTLTPGPAPGRLTADLPVYSGPGTTYSPVGNVGSGTEVQIVGRNTNGDWWQISWPGGNGWVDANFVDVEGQAIAALPLVTPSPPLPFTSTPTQTFTRIPPSPTFTNTPTPAGSPTPEPDDCCVLLVNDTDGYRVLDNQAMGPNDPTNAAFSPDGRLIAATEGVRVYTINQDGSSPHIWMEEDDLIRPVEGIVWSPNGQYFAFVADRKRDCTPPCRRVAIAVLATQQIFYLEPPEDRSIALPRWLQDGRLMVTIYPSDPANGVTYIYEATGVGRQAERGTVYILSSNYKGQAWYPWQPGRSWQANPTEPHRYYED